MLSGELHYWRVARQHWERALRATADLGVDTIGTYVPWNVHETSEGRYDFSLLIDFLELVAAHNLKVFIRPGPYIYAEWRNLGVPDHAVAFHKLHREFKAKAGPWIEAVMGALRPYLGTLITMLQADNEIDPMLHVYGEDLGFSEWLRSRYSSVERLNGAWGCSLASFDDARPWFIPGSDSRQAQDSAQYWYDLATTYARWVVGEYRRHGCTVPIVLNTWPGVNAQNWRDLQEVADVFGIDPYPSNECRTDHRYVCERLRLLRAVSRQPLVTELGCGIWEGADREYTPDHYRLLAMTALMTGVRGWNWYMLVERDRWHGSVIDTEGFTRPVLGVVLKECATAFRALRGAPPPLVSCGVTWSWRHEQAAETLRIASGDVFASETRRPLTQRDTLLEALYEAGVEYDFVDADREIIGPPIVFHAGAVDNPEHLWRYVDRGGQLVLFQDLMEGCVEPAGTSHPYAKDLAVSIGFTTNRAVFSYDTVPGTPLIATQREGLHEAWASSHAALPVGRAYTVGHHQRRGAGSVTLLGCWPCREALTAMHRFLGIEIPALPRTPGIHAAVRGDYLVVVNPGEEIEAEIEIWGAIRRVALPRCSGVVLAKE